MKKVNIFLMEDHKIVRDGLKSILAGHPYFIVSGEESAPDKFIEQLPQLNFDILILDVSLPSMSGIDLIKKVKQIKTNAQVVMLSMHDNPEYMFKSLKEGANAYLPKDIQAEEFIKAIEQVHAKGSYFPDSMQFNTTETITPSHEGSGNSSLLTTRETEILSLTAKGMSSRQIAEKLSLSPRTVETHRVNIMKKLGTSNGAETVALALKLKLIQEEVF